jgi:hypothetical protein
MPPTVMTIERTILEFTWWDFKSFTKNFNLQPESAPGIARIVSTFHLTMAYSGTWSL